MGREAYEGAKGLAASGRPRLRRILPRVAGLATALILLGAKLSLYAAHTIRAELLVAGVARDLACFCSCRFCLCRCICAWSSAC